jgi:hypothetical protein
MKLRGFSINQFDSLVRFNEKVFPIRDNVAEFIKYNFYFNPTKHESGENIILAEDDNGAIIGQFFLMHTFFYFNGKKYKGFWGIDYIVDELYRGTNTGSVLARRALKNEHYFTVGSSEISTKIHLALKQRIIGSIIKYIRLNSAFTILKFLIKAPQKELKSYHFPDSIRTSKGDFKRVFNSDEIISENGYWNSDSLEFIRDKKYIDWRFFFYHDKYFVYKYSSDNDNKDPLPVFFVVRPVCWKNVNCLLLVDFRYNLDADFCFDEITRATVKLMKSTKLSAIITGSSVYKHKRQLNWKLFLSFGEKMHVITKFITDFENEAYVPDRLVLTFADCDCDYYFGNKKW